MTMKMNEAVGHALREIRQGKSLTLSQVADKAFISIAHISDCERGQKTLSPELLEALAFALDTPSYEIVLSAGKLMRDKHLTEVATTW